MLPFLYDQMIEAMPIIDLVFKLSTLLSVVVAGGAIIWRMSRMATCFEIIGETQAREIASLKDEMIELRKLMTAVAVQKVMLEGQAERLNLLDRRYEELRHGRGYVVSTHQGGE